MKKKIIGVKGLCGIPLSSFDDETLLDILLGVSTELGKRMDKDNPFRLKDEKLLGAKKADGNLDPYKEDLTNPRTYCFDCSVHLCCKDSNGFEAWGHSSSKTSFRCPRNKRCHSWKEVREEKARIKKEAKK